jgi:hypothetical protein
LSEAEKASIRESYKLFNDEIVEELILIADQLRPGEGRLFLRTVHRYKSIVQPVSSAAEGVRVPLDAVHDSGTQISIWIPEDLESHADSALLTDVLRYAAHVKGVKLHRTRGNLPDSELGNWFVMGYITELLSNQVIKQIKHSKESPYSLGRACARVKLLMASVSQSKIPSTYLQVPDRFLGGISQFKEPEISRALKTYFTASDAETIEKLLQVLSSHLIKMDKEGVRGKLDVNLFMPPETVINKAKRHVTVTERTAKGRSKTVSQTVTPTKPSQLATVAPWERSSVAELYEQAWEEERSLVEEFKKVPHLERDYIGFRKKLSGVFERQWGGKQTILRSTAHRLGGYPGDQTDPLFRKLNWVRDILKQYGSLETIPDAMVSDFNPSMLLPRNHVVTSEGKAVHYLPYLSSEEGKDRFPATCQLIDAWEGMQTARAGANKAPA